MEKITLKAARVNKGLTQREASDLAGITKETLRSYENGRRIPRADVLIRLLNIYNVSLEQVSLWF